MVLSFFDIMSQRVANLNGERERCTSIVVQAIAYQGSREGKGLPSFGSNLESECQSNAVDLCRGHEGLQGTRVDQAASNSARAKLVELVRPLN